MCAWTHRADGKPISKNFQDRADYMKSGTAKIDITKEHFRIQDSVSDPTAHSVVMATDKLIDNVPLTDQRGGPVTQLQLKDNESASTAALAAEVVARTAADTAIESNKVTTNTEQNITAKKTFAYASTVVAPAEDVEYEWKSVSEGRTAVEELMYMYDHWPKEVDIALEGLGTDIKAMCALAAEDPEAYYTMRNAAGYGDENGCFWGELPEVIDIPDNSTSDITEIDNEGLRVERVDEEVGARGSDIAAGELGVMSEDTNDFRSGITLRSPNIYDTTVLGLHEPEIHVTSKVGTSQVQRYFTFPTNGGVIATQPKAWTLIKRFGTGYDDIVDGTVYPINLSGYTDIYTRSVAVTSHTGNEEVVDEENGPTYAHMYLNLPTSLATGGDAFCSLFRFQTSSTTEITTASKIACNLIKTEPGFGLVSYGGQGYTNSVGILTEMPSTAHYAFLQNEQCLLFNVNASDFNSISFAGTSVAIDKTKFWGVEIYAR